MIQSHHDIRLAITQVSFKHSKSLLQLKKPHGTQSNSDLSFANFFPLRDTTNGYKLTITGRYLKEERTKIQILYFISLLVTYYPSYTSTRDIDIPICVLSVIVQPYNIPTRDTDSYRKNK